VDLSRRYRAVGGVTAWRVPILFGFAMLTLLSLGEWTAACVIAFVGLVYHTADRAAVLEVSPAGLARGFLVGTAFLGPARVLAWPLVEEVTTRWRGPRDFTVLETTVRSRDGITVRFTSRMGFPEYRALVAEVVRRAPTARRLGLTDEVLADPPPATPRRARLLRVALLAALALLGVVAIAVL
jgi:hypothetical protein